jgi:hypothetical protein
VHIALEDTPSSFVVCIIEECQGAKQNDSHEQILRSMGRG